MTGDYDLDGYGPSAGVKAAEMAIVGAVIQSRDALDEAVVTLDAGDFYKPAHQLIFAAAQAVVEARLKLEPTAVLEEIQKRGQLIQTGGGPYLHTLQQHAAWGNTSHHANLVSGDALRRRVQEACRRGTQITESDAWDPDLDLDLIRKMLDEAAVRRTGEPPEGVTEAMLALLDDLESPPAEQPGIVPPYVDLADLVLSFRGGEVIVIGARPAQGKTTLATDILRKAAIEDGHRSVMFTLEMSERDLLQRLTAAEARVNLRAIREYRVNAAQLNAIADASTRICSAPLTIDDAENCTLERVRATLRTMQRTDPARLVVIDYLQLMTPPKAPSREQEVATLSRGLKLLAKEFDIPVVVLSQLNRKAEERADKRPHVSDLRESGAVEQDADMVILLHREDAYEPDGPRAGEADLIVAKNRNGPTATITVANQLHYGRFADMTRDEEPTGRPDLRAAV